MSCPSYIVVSKWEWERLKKQAGHQEPSGEEQHREERLRNLRALDEQSQQWISTWPDSTQATLEKRDARRREKKLRTMRDLKYYQELTKMEDNGIQIAKQRIFDSCGYGHQLISALLESKTLEEREAQIEFQKEIKQKELEIQEALGPKGMTLDLRHDHDAEDMARKQKFIENAQINKNVHKIKKEKIEEERKKEQLLELEDAKQAQKILEFEAHAMDYCKEASLQMAKDSEEDRKKYREMRAAREKLDNDITKVWKDYQDTVWCKQRDVMNRIHKSRYNQPHFQRNYELTEKIYKDSNKRYEDFINKRAALESMENELTKKALEDNEDLKREKQTTIELAALNKKTADNREIIRRPNLCLRQSLFTKSWNPASKQNDVKTVTCVCDEKEGVYRPPPLPPPRSELAQALRRRAALPPPWSGADAADAYFSKRAADTLAQCKHKQFVRKVVDEYLKVNYMDSSTLPVQNY